MWYNIREFIKLDPIIFNLKPEAIVMAAAEVKPAVTGTEIKSITKPIEAKQKSYFGIKSLISNLNNFKKHLSSI